MGGLFVATFLTILFLPALYALWFRRSLDVTVDQVAPAKAAEKVEREPRELAGVPAE
jgi:multidrug efflux pump